MIMYIGYVEKDYSDKTWPLLNGLFAKFDTKKSEDINPKSHIVDPAYVTVIFFGFDVSMKEVFMNTKYEKSWPVAPQDIYKTKEQAKKAFFSQLKPLKEEIIRKIFTWEKS